MGTVGSDKNSEADRKGHSCQLSRSPGAVLNTGHYLRAIRSINPESTVRSVRTTSVWPIAGGERLLSEVVEQTYRFCVQQGSIGAEELSAAMKADRSTSLGAVTELARLGLVRIDDGVVTPVYPMSALQPVAHSKAQQAIAAWEAALTLSEVWTTAHQRSAAVEMLSGGQQTREAVADVLRDAGSDVAALSVSPSLDVPDLPASRPLPGSQEAIARGVRFRVVYGQPILSSSETLKAVKTSVANGEEARYLPHAPIDMILCDDRRAIITPSGIRGGPAPSIVVYEPSLLDSLLAVFESCWWLAVPLSHGGDLSGPDSEVRGGLTDDQRLLLTLLAAGLTDESIARQLGVSERTVGRRLSRLQMMLGVNSRFQLGVQVTRRGWM
ncbi:LuxR C-terminal-related transcriptional regulator [Kribbella sp. NPDC056861]|uniref:LuxR C-terminal-related transcriptional regulator n=1 Tax=Kribbella sp. NPDC056861 TaxID=3154857 RepID=UPI00341A1B46